MYIRPCRECTFSTYRCLVLFCKTKKNSMCLRKPFCSCSLMLFINRTGIIMSLKNVVELSADRFSFSSWWVGSDHQSSQRQIREAEHWARRQGLNGERARWPALHGGSGASAREAAQDSLSRMLLIYSEIFSFPKSTRIWFLFLLRITLT